MKDVIAITSTVYALATLLWAYSLQYHQSRATTPNAGIPVLPFVSATALFITFAIWGFDIGLPWWAYPVVFIVTLFFPGCLIKKACTNSSRKARASMPDRTINNRIEY
jgi:hypothetical protein